MFISSSTIPRSRALRAGAQDPEAPIDLDKKEKGFEFNIGRLIVAAVLLVVILMFAIGTAFFSQLAEIHTMLVHAFELVLGLVGGLLGGEAIAKAETS